MEEAFGWSETSPASESDVKTVKAPPDQAAYQSWVRNGLNERADYEDLWRKCRAYYANRQEAVEELEEFGGRTALVNRIKSTIDTIFPASSLRDPKIIVQPRHARHNETAPLVELMVNAWWRLYDARTHFRISLLDCLQIGHGWVKTTWDHQEHEEEAEPDLFNQEGGTKTVVDHSRPKFMCVDPFDMVIDPESTGMHDIRWLCQRSFESLPKVWGDSRYKGSVRRKVRAATLVGGAEEDRRGQIDNPDTEREPDPRLARAEIWEMWDLENEVFAVWASGTDGWLVEPRPFPYESGHPFERLDRYIARGFLYPIGEIEPLLYLQDELNYTRTDMLEHRSRASSKMLVDSRVVSDEFSAGLKSREPLTVIPTQTTDAPLSEAVYPVPIPVIPADYYNLSEVISNDMDEISGVSEYRRGDVPSRRTSATEAAIVADAQAVRTAEVNGVVETAARNVARRIVQLAQEMLANAQQVPDENSPDGFALVTRDRIDGVFEYVVEIGSMAPRDDIALRQEAIALWSAAVPLAGMPLDAEGSMINLAALWRLILQRHGVQEADEYLTTAPEGEEQPPSAMAQEMMMQRQLGGNGGGALQGPGGGV